MIKALNYVLIFVFAAGLSLFSSMHDVYSQEKEFEDRIVVEINDQGEQFIGASVIVPFLVKEGVGLALNFFKGKIDDYKSKAYEGTYVDIGVPDENNMYIDPTIPFSNIRTIRIHRGKSRQNESGDYEFKDKADFDLRLDVQRTNAYIRLVPSTLEFNDSIAGGNTKDINIDCSFEFPKAQQETKNDSKSSKGAQKFLIPPVTFTDIEEGKTVSEEKTSRRWYRVDRFT